MGERTAELERRFESLVAQVRKHDRMAWGAFGSVHPAPNVASYWSAAICDYADRQIAYARAQTPEEAIARVSEQIRAKKDYAA